MIVAGRPHLLSHEKKGSATRATTCSAHNRQRTRKRDLGIENFRMLMVATDTTRVEKMHDALEAITNGKGIIERKVDERGQAPRADDLEEAMTSF